MCGIVGYVGHRNCSDVLVSALTRLEYRGYDSAGIAVFENGKIAVQKSKGKLQQLIEKMETEGKPDGHAGIGHTRWATHGEPSDINSHPHSGAKVTLVHNGIIENYKELKDFLIKSGRVFLSDTDTEVVAQLLDHHYTYISDPVNAIIRTAQDIRGSFALGIVFQDYPDTVFAIRRESPLVIGVGKDESFIASDVPAIIEYTRDYYLLEHDEIAVLNKEGIKVYDTHHQPIVKTLKTADWDVNAVGKCGYPHYMIKEINEQPTAIEHTVSPRISDGMPNLEECNINPESLRKIRNIFIVACGTAMHAGMVGKYVMEKLARTPVTVDIASEFRYRDPLIGKGDLIIIVSQSGETADSLAAMRLAKEKGASTLAIVNAMGSTIAREADMLIYTHAGPEISVASTKAYMVQLSVMYIFAFELAYAKGCIDEEKCKYYTSKLLEMPELVKGVIESTTETSQKVATQLIKASSLLYIGRGLDYALSMEGSLKLKEISYIHSESYAAGELKHGTISLITKNMPVIAVATQSDLYEKTVSNIKEVKARGAKVIMICKESDDVKGDVADYLIKVPAFEEVLLPMLVCVPLQLIAYYTAVERGNDVDQPRNLAKSVTVE